MSSSIDASSTCANESSQVSLGVFWLESHTRQFIAFGNIHGIVAHFQSSRFVFTWIAELAFGTSIRSMKLKQSDGLLSDSIMFFATLYRVIMHNRLRHGNAMNLVDLILRDGMYRSLGLLHH
jgi:hypothetical protein